MTNSRNSRKLLAIVAILLVIALVWFTFQRSFPNSWHPSLPHFSGTETRDVSLPAASAKALLPAAARRAVAKKDETKDAVARADLNEASVSADVPFGHALITCGPGIETDAR